ncbi:APLF factor, partial [Corythaeola cristata]|nr:APLF factor [Corythaeola cristata]
NQEADAEEGPTVHPVEMSCSPSLIEPAHSNSEIQGTAKMRKNDATSRRLVPLSDDSESEQSKSIQRKRVLPSWMLERDLLVRRISEPVMKGGSRMKKGQGRGESNVESLKSEVNVQQKKRSASEETIEDFGGEEQDQGKRSRLSIPVPSSQVIFWLRAEPRNCYVLKKDSRECSYSTLSKSESKIGKKNNVKSRTTCGNEVYCQCFCAQVGILEPDANLDDETEISDSTRSADAAESSNQIKPKRTPCMYGTGCYRKNPIHFQQFSHPHDDDYHEVEIVTQDSNNDRPECPYGTACYRKNPQHKLEYKHSAPPGKRAVEKDDANDEEPNEYDLNDSFVDDEEEECEPTDEDSDWEAGSEDQDNEDVETLLQEARRFVKAKK